MVSTGGVHILELFHGPTLAFKDIALQFLGNLFEYLLLESGAQMNILGATSGDTGSAAIYGVRGKRGINIFILHPHGKVSPVQELQMTTVTDANVYNLAIRGTFDDGQRIVKEIFGDLEFKKRYALGAVNSINWARVLAQVVYYFYAWARVRAATGREVIDVSVPTGNFGDIFAGYVARRMGLPIRRLVLATNENNILTRFVNDGDYSLGDVHPTLSPSMDIQVASNFERYLYYLYGQDPMRVRSAFAEFARSGRLTFTRPSAARSAAEFRSHVGRRRRHHRRDPHLPRRDRLRARSAHGRRRPRRPGPGHRRRADGLPRHRPPGQVPGRRAPGHRPQPRPPGQPRRAGGAAAALRNDRGRDRPSRSLSRGMRFEKSLSAWPLNGACGTC